MPRQVSETYIDEKVEDYELKKWCDTLMNQAIYSDVIQRRENIHNNCGISMFVSLPQNFLPEGIGLLKMPPCKGLVGGG